MQCYNHGRCTQISLLITLVFDADLLPSHQPAIGSSVRGPSSVSSIRTTVRQLRTSMYFFNLYGQPGVARRETLTSRQPCDLMEEYR